MTDREQYAPGPASGAQVRKDGEKWTLILVRELRHSPEKVWQALTDPTHLREWAPFVVDGNLDFRVREHPVGGLFTPERLRNGGPYVTEILFGVLQVNFARVDASSKSLRWVALG